MSSSWTLSKTNAVLAELFNEQYEANGNLSQDQIPTSLNGILKISLTEKYGYLKDLASDNALKQYEDVVYPAIYFDPTASDDLGDGSIGRPYKNLTAGRLKPGYRHLIKSGTTITTGSGDPWLSIPNTSTDKSPIIIGKYGESNIRPIIDGSACTKVIRGATGAKNWRIRDIEIIGPQSGTTRYAISQQSVDATADQNTPYNILISNVKIHDVVTDTTTDCNGIKLYGAGNVVIGCEIFDIATDAIWFHGFRTKISGCKIYRVANDGRNAGDCIQCGARSDGSIVRGNYLDHFEVDIKQCIYFEQTISISNNVLIEDNYCVSADGTAGAAGPITCGATNSIVRRNYCKGGYVGILVGEGSIAHHNIVISTVGRGIDCKSNSKVYNNTIVQIGSDTTQSWSVGIRAQAGDVNVSVKCNLLIGQYNGILCASSNGVPNITESQNAFATRGVSNAMYRVDGVVTTPTNPVTATYATYASDLSIDDNFRIKSKTSPLCLDIENLCTDFYTKDYTESSYHCIGAFDY